MGSVLLLCHLPFCMLALISTYYDIVQKQLFGFGPKENSIWLMVFGVSSFIAQTLLLPLLVPIFQEKLLLVAAVLCLGGSFLLFAVGTSALWV